METFMDNLFSIFSTILKHTEPSNRALASMLGISHGSVGKYRGIIAGYPLDEAALLQLGEAAGAISAPAQPC